MEENVASCTTLALYLPWIANKKIKGSNVYLDDFSKRNLLPKKKNTYVTSGASKHRQSSQARKWSDTDGDSILYPYFALVKYLGLDRLDRVNAHREGARARRM